MDPDKFRNWLITQAEIRETDWLEVRTESGARELRAMRTEVVRLLPQRHQCADCAWGTDRPHRTYRWNSVRRQWQVQCHNCNRVKDPRTGVFSQRVNGIKKTIDPEQSPEQ